MITFSIPFSVGIPVAEIGTIVDDSCTESRLGEGVHANSGAEIVAGTVSLIFWVQLTASTDPGIGGRSVGAVKSAFWTKISVSTVCLNDRGEHVYLYLLQRTHRSSGQGRFPGSHWYCQRWSIARNGCVQGP